jgi:UDP-N-acetylglucosamine 2-epimerase (non-hydrolysing)
MRIVCVAGARPNFVKIAPLMAALRAASGVEPILVHTGQHYDEKMSGSFFRDLGMSAPDVDLGVGSGSHAVQTARIMQAFEPVLVERRADAVLVVGDVNSTVACGLVAVKLGVPLVHVEAGLRSFDRSMPEEINRVLTDAMSDLLFCTERAAVDNLAREGKSAERVFLVGNVMIDSLLANLGKAHESKILDELSLRPGGYGVLTLHRPANVDDRAAADGLFDAIETVQKDIPLVFPVHPRTRGNLDNSPLGNRLGRMRGLVTIPPAGYLDFLKLVADARVVLTDSGGIQEETTVLKVPCLTLRNNTERPITAEIGTNRVVGTEPLAIVAAWREIQAGVARPCGLPPLWDGKAAQRIAGVLADILRPRNGDLLARAPGPREQAARG